MQYCIENCLILLYLNSKFHNYLYFISLINSLRRVALLSFLCSVQLNISSVFSQNMSCFSPYAQDTLCILKYESHDTVAYIQICIIPIRFSCSAVQPKKLIQISWKLKDQLFENAISFFRLL